jgi:hypothetical protein
MHDASIGERALETAEANTVADAILAVEEMIQPVTEGHPEITLGETLREIERQTDETIRGLEEEK